MWKLHIYAFQCMLPLFKRYDHMNYARWGTNYLNEMDKNCFSDPIHKNKPITFLSLFKPNKKSSKHEKDKVIRADRLVLQRLISAYEVG